MRVSLNDARGVSILKKAFGGSETSVSKRFVAISHVLADGIGNPLENALHECQISRLQILVNKLYPAKYWAIPLWIDILCIPVNDPEVRNFATG